MVPYIGSFGSEELKKKYLPGCVSGDIVTAVVDQADPHGVVKDSEIVKALIVRTKKEYRRPDGSHVRFDDNAGVIINKEGEPRGTRIFGPIAREIKEKGYAKIASLATEVV